MYRTPTFVTKPPVSNLLEYSEPREPCPLCNWNGNQNEIVDPNHIRNHLDWNYQMHAQFHSTGQPCGYLISKHWWKPAVYCKEIEGHFHATCKQCKVHFAMKPPPIGRYETIIEITNNRIINRKIWIES